jgi:hypothetical protein
MESENHQTAFRHLGSACPRVTCFSGSITLPCFLGIDRVTVCALCILLKSKHFDLDECVCIYVGYLQGPQDFKGRGVPHMQERVWC